MGIIRLTNLSGINLKTNPLNTEGELTRAVNVDPYHIGSWKKRPGFVTYLGTPDNASISCLFNFTKNNGTELYNYRISGGTVYHSVQGTTAWAVAGNGTLTAGAFTSPGFLENTMIIGDGTANTRHTTNGTVFVDTSSAPKAQFFTDYQNRIWAGGTASFAFFSTTGTPTDWTSDSSSIAIPGPGKINGAFKNNDRVVFPKTSGAIFKYDGGNLIDIATTLGPSSPQSISEVEGFNLYLNRLGVFSFSGGRPDIISNKIEKQIYNDLGSAIVGTVFDNAPGVDHRYDYILSVGSITDDLTNESLSNAMILYDYQLNDFRNYTFPTRPTSWLSYKDNTGNQQLIFGDAGGQCYQMSGTSLSDNGTAINVVIEGFIHGSSFLEKKWNWFRGLFNPGCEANIQVALLDTFTQQSKNWITLGQSVDGVAEYRFPEGSRSRFLFYRISESSTTARFEFYGLECDADIIPR